MLRKTAIAGEPLFHDDSGITAPTLKGTATRAASVLLSRDTPSDAGNGRVVHHQYPCAAPLPPPGRPECDRTDAALQMGRRIGGNGGQKARESRWSRLPTGVLQSPPPADPGSTVGRLDSLDPVKRLTDYRRVSRAGFRHQRIALVTTCRWLSLKLTEILISNSLQRLKGYTILVIFTRKIIRY